MAKPVFKMYLWKGRRVLVHYSSGMVTIIARTEDEAWERLRLADPKAYWLLKTGRDIYVWNGLDTPEAIQRAMDADVEEYGTEPEQGYPILPVAWDLDDKAPALVIWGSE